MAEEKHSKTGNDHTFSGNIYIFHAFDIGDEVDLEDIESSGILIQQPLTLSKYFKNYHIPLAVELPHPHASSHCQGVKIHNFGTISLTYKIPFRDTLKQTRKELEDLSNKFQEQSINDANALFKTIKPFIRRPKFFQTKSDYLLMQVNTEPTVFTDIAEFRKQYGGIIASMVRFETESLSEIQKDEILESAIGYYRGDFIVIDIGAAFVYDKEYEEILDFFEFANIQNLELRYFDRLLDQQLNIIYEEKVRKLSVRSYIPFIGTLSHSPVDELGKLRVDISVITERLEGSIKLAGEPYFSELYDLLVQKLDLLSWRNSIERKLAIIQDIRSVFQHKTDAAREDLLSVLIIILIFIELIIGILHYLRS
ncbi:hypothetical protein E3J79_02295 [Candidatus Dependentiae bacterium]|nr:MAG: hypothetical protein E3J79_02295 [Candidatus Dependentiae bacterium]